jgi:hypothetical protein
MAEIDPEIEAMGQAVWRIAKKRLIAQGFSRAAPEWGQIHAPEEHPLMFMSQEDWDEQRERLRAARDALVEFRGGKV